MIDTRDIKSDEQRRAQSPAVESLKREHAKQEDLSADEELEKGLKESFPASDPVSVSNPNTSTGRVDPDDHKQPAG